MAKKKKKQKKKTRAGHRRLQIALIVCGALAVLLAAAYFYVRSHYTIAHIYVNGNTHYTEAEIVEMVMNDKLSENSLYLALRYRNRPITGVPFVERMDVEVLSPDTVRIRVYEKALAGYIEYLGRYMYFDRSGVVVESSEIATPGIPEVMGLSFDYVVLYEPLPVGDPDVFEEVLTIAQVLEKNALTADRIFFDKNNHVYLYFGNIRAEIGDDTYINEKIAQLPLLLPRLEGRSGILRMKDYTPGATITFDED